MIKYFLCFSIEEFSTLKLTVHVEVIAIGTKSVSLNSGVDNHVCAVSAEVDNLLENSCVSRLEMSQIFLEEVSILEM